MDVICCGQGTRGGRGADEEDIALPVLLVSAGSEDAPQHQEQQGDRIPESPHDGCLRVSPNKKVFSVQLYKEDDSRATCGLLRSIR